MMKRTIARRLLSITTAAFLTVGVMAPMAFADTGDTGDTASAPTYYLYDDESGTLGEFNPGYTPIPEGFHGYYSHGDSGIYYLNHAKYKGETYNANDPYYDNTLIINDESPLSSRKDKLYFLDPAGHVRNLRLRIYTLDANGDNDSSNDPENGNLILNGTATMDSNYNLTIQLAGKARHPWQEEDYKKAVKADYNVVLLMNNVDNDSFSDEDINIIIKDTEGNTSSAPYRESHVRLGNRNTNTFTSASLEDGTYTATDTYRGIRIANPSNKEKTYTYISMDKILHNDPLSADDRWILMNEKGFTSYQTHLNENGDIAYFENKDGARMDVYGNIIKAADKDTSENIKEPEKNPDNTDPSEKKENTDKNKETATPEENQKKDSGNNQEANKFTDVSDTDYFFNPVLWAVKSGITSGTSENTFSPDSLCTRGQLVTFLWRAAGSPEVKTSDNPFTDVSRGSYYYKAVLWAYEEGILSGTSATTASPDDTVTRAQAVTLEWKANGSEKAASAGSFSDVDAGAWYAQAVGWAVANKVTGGTSADTFSPDKGCTRAEAVTFMYRIAK